LCWCVDVLVIELMTVLMCWRLCWCVDDIVSMCWWLCWWLCRCENVAVLMCWWLCWCWWHCVQCWRVKKVLMRCWVDDCADDCVDVLICWMIVLHCVDVLMTVLIVLMWQ
jgi:hypothetical protein